MKIIEMPIETIIPYVKNPRKNDQAVAQVARSIQEFGFKVPVIIDKNNEIVAGHTRVKAAKKLGFASIPCIIVDDLTPEQIKAFRLADNKVGEVAEWDANLLIGELNDIVSLDMSGFGFDPVEEMPDITKVELQPYKKVHYLISVDINDHDKIIDDIARLRESGVCEVEDTLN